LARRLTSGSGQTVLDVAAGNGNVSLAAARRWCDVIATDYVPALLEPTAHCSRPLLLSNPRRNPSLSKISKHSSAGSMAQETTLWSCLASILR
jgi:hypothetical protein